MNGSLMAALTTGTVLMCAFPVVLLVFGLLTVRAGRRGELAADGFQASIRLLGVSSTSAAFYFVGGLSHLPVMTWAGIGIILVSAALCGLFLRTPLTRPLKAISMLLLFELLFVAAFGSFAVWIAGRASQISAYNNPDEAEVRTALAKNPNDAAAHSSLAHLDMMRGDHAEEIAEWKQVLRVEPGNDEAAFLLGLRLSQSGRTGEARPLFQRLAAGSGAYRGGARKWLARHGGL